MKHSKQYIDAMYVINNPESYVYQQLMDAMNYVKGYEDALKAVYNDKCKKCGYNLDSDDNFICTNLGRLDIKNTDKP